MDPLGMNQSVPKREFHVRVLNVAIASASAGPNLHTPENEPKNHPFAKEKSSSIHLPVWGWTCYKVGPNQL